MQLGNLISNDQFLNSLPKNAKDLLLNGINIEGLRGKYGLTTPNEGLQKEYDFLMATAERTESYYKNSLERLNKLKQIKNRIDTVKTPAEKADIANSLALFQAELAQEQIALKQAEYQLQTQQEIERRIANEKFAQSLRDGEKAYMATFSK